MKSKFKKSIERHEQLQKWLEAEMLMPIIKEFCRRNKLTGRHIKLAKRNEHRKPS
jgi:hypothetical protein